MEGVLKTILRRFPILFLLVWLAAGFGMPPSALADGIQDLRRQARSLENSGRTAEAENTYREMTRVAPDNAKSWFYLGQFLVNQDRIEEAVPPLQKALTLRPGLRYAHLLLAECAYRQGRMEEALDHLKQEDAVSPGLGDTHFWRGLVYQKQNRWDAAREELRQALDGNTAYRVETHVALGVAYINLDDQKAAKENLEKSLKIYKRQLGTAASAKRWHLRLGTLTFYTDNVAGLNDKIAKPVSLESRHDFAWAYFFNAGYRAVETRHFDLDARYDFYHDIHGRASEYNLLSQAITLRPALHAGNWTLASDLAWQHETLGGDPYRWSWIAHPSLNYLYKRLLTSFGYKVRRTFYHTSPAVGEQDRDNVANSLDLTFYYFPSRWLESVYFGPEIGRENNDGTDYDHDYYLFRGGFKTQEYQRFTLGFDAAFGFANYDHPNTLALIFREQRRRSKELDLAVTVGYRLTDGWQLFGRWNYQRNAANINVYDNTINTVSLGTQVEF